NIPDLHSFPTRRSSDLHDPAEEDFVLDLVREPAEPTEVPESIRAMRARRVQVHMPTGVPSVQEVLLNPADASVSGQPSRATVRRSEEHTSELQSRFDLV